MAMLGMPLRFLGATIILAVFVIGPKILTSFGITNDFIAFFVMPLVVFGFLVFVFCIYAANVILNPARFMIIMPFLLLLAGLLTYGLYM